MLWHIEHPDFALLLGEDGNYGFCGPIPQDYDVIIENGHVEIVEKGNFEYPPIPQKVTSQSDSIMLAVFKSPVEA